MNKATPGKTEKNSTRTKKEEVHREGGPNEREVQSHGGLGQKSLESSPEPREIKGESLSGEQRGKPVLWGALVLY